ncbi:MAG: 3'-5' exonuclease [Ignavibacteriae bacterium]|nr:3'-5' exonuclease [Ignavibacteriota bacterium]
MIFNFLKNKTSKKYPEFWKNYISLFEEKQNYKIPISQTDFVIIDVESTGLAFKKDKILSVGGLRIKNNQIDVSNTFEIYLEQDEFNPHAALVHGILKKSNSEKISEQDGIIKFLKFIKNDIIVGHSISFDISIINETINRNGGSKLLNKSIDTINLYKRIKGEDYKIDSSVSLDTISEEFKITKSDRHNAAGDALITAILFMKLISKLKKRGVTELESLLKNKRTLF